MSVATFDPSETESMELRMSERALAHARTRIADSGAAGIRLGVKESGCSGFMYEVSMVDEPAPDDIEFDMGEGVRLFVARDHLHLVAGTCIDYVTEGLNSTMKFDNPNAHSMCGCGESFAVG